MLHINVGMFFCNMIYLIYLVFFLVLYFWPWPHSILTRSFSQEMDNVWEVGRLVKHLFLHRSWQKTKWVSRSLFTFPPWSKYVGTNVPVTTTEDHTEVRRQREDLQHKQHNYLPHSHANCHDMCRPVRQRQTIEPPLTVNVCHVQKRHGFLYRWRVGNSCLVLYMDSAKRQRNSLVCPSKCLQQSFYS